MGELLDRLRQVLPQALQGYGVDFAYLYGSQATGNATPRSDIDVALHLADPVDDPVTTANRFAGIVERASGLGPVEVVVLNDAPLSLAGRIREQGQLIHCRDDVARVRWESLTARRHHDFRIHEERSATERLERLASDH